MEGEALPEEPTVKEPERLLCPITHTLFRDPVFNCIGNTYERSALTAYWANGVVRDPLTNDLLPSQRLTTNWDKRREVEGFLAAHPEYTPAGWPERSMIPVDAEAVERARQDTLAQRHGPREYRVNVYIEINLEGWKGYTALAFGLLAVYSWLAGKSMKQVISNSLRSVQSQVWTLLRAFSTRLAERVRR
eukprot:TRINITY_DN110226_c0_g1_i1.p1 TRINITY_DN110226_c0_g1~~TRINITY_DN110226_c0_g1_i1.p1  ORF type:complete len:190 (+),score=36.24 TRINITY_DN110226_c0_g1_i1:72-641(+)